MGIKVRSVLLVALAALSFGTPARAAAPLTLVVGGEDGALLRVTVDASNTVSSRRVLMPAAGRLDRTPAHVSRGLVSVAVWSYPNGRSDSLLVDPRTGKVVGGRKDGRTGQLFVSPDGRTHIAVKADEEGGLIGVLRTDARGRSTKALLAPDPAVALSGIALSPDGRTVYVARTVSEDEQSILYAVDVATGTRREIAYLAPYQKLLNTVVSPDGKRLALTFFEDTTLTFKAGVLDLDRLGVVRPVDAAADTVASSFAPDGRLLLSQWDHDSVGHLAFADPTTLLTTVIAGSTGLRGAWAVP